MCLVWVVLYLVILVSRFLMMVGWVLLVLISMVRWVEVGVVMVVGFLGDLVCIIVEFGVSVGYWFWLVWYVVYLV